MSATGGVPQNYSELFSMYRVYVETLVLRLGVSIDNREDVASDIFEKLYERDVIGMFDANHIGWHGRQAGFKTFLSAFVVSYARGMRERMHKRQQREPLLCDTLVEGAYGRPTVWLTIHGPSYEDVQFLAHEEQEAEAQLVEHLRQHLSEIEHPGTQCDLLRLFDEAVKQARRDGVLSYPELSKTMGTSLSSLRTWMKWIVSQLREEVHAL